MGDRFQFNNDWELLSRLLPEGTKVLRMTSHTLRMICFFAPGRIDQETEVALIEKGILGYVSGTTIKAAPEAHHFEIHFERGSGSSAEYLGAFLPGQEELLHDEPAWFNKEKLAALDAELTTAKVMLLTFGEALRALKQGKKVRRAGWAGDDHVVLHKGFPNGTAINQNAADATGKPVGTLCGFQPFLLAFTENSYVPWTPSMLDVLAEDWVTLG